MNDAYKNAFAAELATLSRAVAVPVAPFAYGTDLSCTLDLDPRLAEVDPTSPKAIVEAVIRRFITPRGGVIDDQDYGQDVRGMLNRGVTTSDLRAMAGALQGEAQKDDRVARADVQLRASLQSRTMHIAVFITPEDPALKEFSFTFAVTSGEVLGVTING